MYEPELNRRILVAIIRLLTSLGLSEKQAVIVLSIICLIIIIFITVLFIKIWRESDDDKNNKIKSEDTESENEHETLSKP